MPKVGEFHAYNRVGSALDIREDPKLDEDQKANTLITKEIVAPILPPPSTKEE